MAGISVVSLLSKQLRANTDRWSYFATETATTGRLMTWPDRLLAEIEERKKILKDSSAVDNRFENQCVREVLGDLPAGKSRESKWNGLGNRLDENIITESKNLNDHMRESDRTQSGDSRREDETDKQLYLFGCRSQVRPDAEGSRVLTRSRTLAQLIRNQGQLDAGNLLTDDSSAESPRRRRASTGVGLRCAKIRKSVLSRRRHLSDVTENLTSNRTSRTEEKKEEKFPFRTTLSCNPRLTISSPCSVGSNSSAQKSSISKQKESTESIETHRLSTTPSRTGRRRSFVGSRGSLKNGGNIRFLDENANR